MAETHAARARRRESALKGETPFLAGLPYQTIFERVLHELCGSMSTVAMVRYLEGKASYWQIRDWREGRSKPRREVVEWLEGKCRERAARAGAAIAALGRVETGLPYAPNVCAWNARRASMGR